MYIVDFDRSQKLPPPPFLPHTHLLSLPLYLHVSSFLLSPPSLFPNKRAEFFFLKSVCLHAHLPFSFSVCFSLLHTHTHSLSLIYDVIKSPLSILACRGFGRNVGRCRPRARCARRARNGICNRGGKYKLIKRITFVIIGLHNYNYVRF